MAFNETRERWFDKISLIGEKGKLPSNELLVSAVGLLLRKFPGLRSYGPEREAELASQKNAALEHAVQIGNHVTYRDNMVRAVGTGAIGYFIAMAASMGGAVFWMVAGAIGTAVMSAVDIYRNIGKEHAVTYLQAENVITPNPLLWAKQVRQNPQDPQNSVLDRHIKRSALAGVLTLVVFAGCGVYNYTHRQAKESTQSVVKQTTILPTKLLQLNQNMNARG